MQVSRSSLICAGLILAASSAVQAGSLRFTIEAPGITTSQVTGYTKYVEDWNTRQTSDLDQSDVLNTSAGQYVAEPGGTGSKVFGADVFGGAEGVANASDKYLEVDSGGSLLWNGTGVAGGPFVGYFGFWWSAGDGNNELVVTLEDSSKVTFSTQTILDSPALQGSPNMTNTLDGHFGNPVETSTSAIGGNAIEAYAFVNIYATDPANTIAFIEFREPNTASGFETDNHTVIADYIPPDGQTGTDVPVPATALLLGAGMGLIGWTRRHRRG